MGNEPKKDVAARFDILSNTLSTILKNKERFYCNKNNSPSLIRHVFQLHDL
jgi:hypothetical protein